VGQVWQGVPPGVRQARGQTRRGAARVYACGGLGRPHASARRLSLRFAHGADAAQLSNFLLSQVILALSAHCDSLEFLEASNRHLLSFDAFFVPIIDY